MAIAVFALVLVVLAVLAKAAWRLMDKEAEEEDDNPQQ